MTILFKTPPPNLITGFLEVCRQFMHSLIALRFFLDFDEYRITDRSMIGHITFHTSEYQ